MRDLDPPKGCTALPKLSLAEPSGNPEALKFELSETARQACVLGACARRVYVEMHGMV